MEYITTTSCSILVNEILGEPFRSEIGIKHGDPYTLCIFIICAEHPAKYIYSMANILKSGIGVKVSKYGSVLCVDIV